MTYDHDELSTSIIFSHKPRTNAAIGMLKYVGVLLTKEQIFKIASSILKEDIADIHDTNSFLRAFGSVLHDLYRSSPAYYIHPMAIPRRSPKDEDTHFLLVCHVYKNSRETRMNYTSKPVTDRDAKILGWLKENGMESQDILNQWTTVPDPKYDM
ncbi:uncharacterized protein FOMMEDRAFT_151490 [Fomitiporia mediterranea MF3/22]|uniref:uncharacterized protein n=1 Tax=Fomitiporia mediterranea (strain MF3/22) TaxID=694068 RepID=UPI00044072D2|nr:uncharacterized protein FOMMEDRAFT_151490 [Fomitiporia mediterranea MF3/22]EJD08604.1 hypothetical protein FOMMEDRAFT_151490 [Fomitiporia mediterranea MF3/22]